MACTYVAVKKDDSDTKDWEVNIKVKIDNGVQCNKENLLRSEQTAPIEFTSEADRCRRYSNVLKEFNWLWMTYSFGGETKI